MQRTIQIENINFEELKTYLMHDFANLIIEKISQVSVGISSNENTIYSLKQTAEFLDVSEKTMYSLNNRNEIAYIKRLGKCYYTKSDILEYLQQGRVKSFREIEQKVNKLLPTL